MLREFIAKLSKGIFEFGIPEIEVSISSIELDLEKDVIYKGSFDVSCPEGNVIRGLAFSKGSQLELKTEQFIGVNNLITYEISTYFLEPGELISGSINIIVRGREIEIPWAVCVKTSSILASCGEVSDLDSFYELYKEDYDEALSLFYSGDFPRLLQDNESAYVSVYEVLSEGSNKQMALEEFLIETGRKQKVEISLSEKERKYSGLIGTCGDTLLIMKDRQGYVSIKIESDADFIELPQKQISTLDFSGNRYELAFCILEDKLHAGFNYGRIVLSSYRQRLYFEITVKAETNQPGNSKKKILAQLLRLNLDYKTRCINMYEWRQNTENLLDRLEEETIMRPLEGIFFRVEIMIEQGRNVEAQELLAIAAEELMRADPQDKTLYSLYLYYSALVKGEKDYSDKIRYQIQDYFDNGHDSFSLQWILMRLDPALRTNAPLKLSKLREHYRKGSRSPFLYLEVLGILNDNPKDLNSLGSFEASVLSLGAKQNDINAELARRVSDLALSEKSFQPVVFSVLKHLYKKYEDKHILDAICSMLIKGNKTGKEYFDWFALGVEKGSRITSLYEYYMYSISLSEKKPLPQNVLMYFLYNTELLHDRQAFLFYNILINKKEMEPLYRSYLHRMERFAVNEIKKGNLSEFLAVIYIEIFGHGIMDISILESLPQISCTYRLTCENPDIARVIVCFEELRVINEEKLTDSETNFLARSDRFHVIFEDFEGNRFGRSVPYSIDRYFDENRYKQCFLQNPNSELFIVRSISQVLKNTKNHKKTMELLQDMVKNKVLRCWYLKRIMQETIEYFYNRHYDEAVDRYLPHLERDCLYRKTRKDYAAILISREMYNETYKMFERFGVLEIDPGMVMRASLRLISENNFQMDETLLSMSLYAFKNGKYNELLLQYIGMYFFGSIKEMMEIWKAQKGFECESRELEENLLAILLYTRSLSKSRFLIYQSYFQKGGKEEIRRAYQNAEAYEYVMNGGPVLEEYFQYLEQELQERGDRVNDICRIAYLKYNADAQEMLDYQKRLCEKLLGDLMNKNIRLGLFKKYSKWFPIPDSLKDKLIIEHHADCTHKIAIRFRIIDGHREPEEYQQEEMTCVYPGIFTWETILFYGEKLQYKIIDLSMPDKESIVQTNRQLAGEELYMGENRYGIINSSILSLNLKDDETLSDLMMKYLVTDHITCNLFDMDEQENKNAGEQG